MFRWSRRRIMLLMAPPKESCSTEEAGEVTKSILTGPLFEASGNEDGRAVEGRKSNQWFYN